MSPDPWHARDADAVLAGLESDRNGLDSAAAAERLARHGPNRLQAGEKPNTAGARQRWL